MKQNSINKKYRQFNNFIRDSMKDKGINQTQAAEWLNLTQASVSMKLTGKTEWTMREIISLYELLGIEHDFTEEKRSSVKQDRTSKR